MKRAQSIERQVEAAAEDPFRPFQGIGLGVLLAAALWALILYAVL